MDLNRIAIPKRNALFFCLFLGSLTGAGVIFSFDSGAAVYSEAEIQALLSPKEIEIKRLRDAEVGQLEVALGRRLEKNRRADLYFRLAEIHLEAYRAEFLLEGRAHEARLQKGVTEETINRSRSRPHLVRGVQACESILRLNIAYDHMDRVYYFLGYYFDELGKPSQSQNYYKELVKRYPTSPFAGEAFRELGVVEFNKGNFLEAREKFEAAVSATNPQAITLPGIYHKLAWTYYRTRNTVKAIEMAKKSIALAVKSDERFFSVREEALRDLAIFMTESGQVDDAVAYFKEVAGDRGYFGKILLALGIQFERNLQPKKAIDVYRTLLKIGTDDLVILQVQAKLLDLWLRAGDLELAYQQAVQGAAQIKRSNPNDYEGRLAIQNMRALVRRTATENHQKNTPEALKIAERFYSVYLEKFLVVEDSRKESPEIQMYLADIKVKQAELLAARKYYRAVVDSGDTRYSKEAAVFWVDTFLKSIKPKDSSQNKEKLEISESEREFVEASDELQKLLPKSSEARESALRAAQILAGYPESRKKGLDRAAELVSESSESPQAVVAGRMRIQVLTEALPDPQKGDADEFSDRADDLQELIEKLEGNSALLTADRTLGKNELSKAIAESRKRLRLGRIVVLERDKNYKRAAKEMEKLATEIPALEDDLLDRSALSFLKADEIESAEGLSIRALEKSPKKPRALDRVKVTATRVLVLGEFKRASELFRILGTQYGDSSALETSARIESGLGNIGREITAYQEFIRLYPKANNRLEVVLVLAEKLKEFGNTAEAEKNFGECSKGVAPLAARCGVAYADLLTETGKNAEAKNHYLRVSNFNLKNSPEVGYARYRLALHFEESQKFMPLSLPEATLQKGLEERLSFFENLNRHYQRVVVSPGPWVVSALLRLGKWTLEFADQVDRLNPPAGLDPLALSKFKASVTAVSKPLRAKAVAALEQALETAQKAELLSPDMPELKERLFELKNFPGYLAQGTRGRFRLAGLPVDGGKEGSKKAFQRIRTRLLEELTSAEVWIDYGNLLWGDKKPFLAKLAYERAYQLNPKLPAAQNNLGVVTLALPQANEDWRLAEAALEYFKAAVTVAEAVDSNFIPARFNWAMLLNYYRLTSNTGPHFEKVLGLARLPDAFDGMGVVAAGLGKFSSASDYFDKAEDYDAPDRRFVRLYHQAVAVGTGGQAAPSECKKNLERIRPESLEGFEKSAVSYLMKRCSLQ